jgi:hypothetical protein
MSSTVMVDVPWLILVYFLIFSLSLNSRLEIELQFAVFFISALMSIVEAESSVEHVDLFAFSFCTLPIPIGQLSKKMDSFAFDWNLLCIWSDVLEIDVCFVWQCVHRVIFKRI